MSTTAQFLSFCSLPYFQYSAILVAHTTPKILNWILVLNITMKRNKFDMRNPIRAALSHADIVTTHKHKVLNLPKFVINTTDTCYIRLFLRRPLFTLLTLWKVGDRHLCNSYRSIITAKTFLVLNWGVDMVLMRHFHDYFKIWNLYR